MNLASNRVKKLPPYLFLEIDRAKRAALTRGADIIDFGIGDPDQPTPGFIIEALNEALKNPATHRYPLDRGYKPFREAIAEWYQNRFDVTLDPETEILPLIGSKEGLTHLPLAMINPGERVWLPDPAYPAYRSGVLFAGGVSDIFELKADKGFLPDLAQIKKKSTRRHKLIYLNYPNNPTGAVTDLAFFKELVGFAKKTGIHVVHDNAYSELYFDGKKPPSFLEAEGAKHAGLEFHSLSKTFNMTGWRVGFACGNAQMIEALLKVKSNIDSGVFSAIQAAGAVALKRSAEVTRAFNQRYQKRRDVLLSGLKSLGLNPPHTEATFYVWTPLPKGFRDSMVWTRHLLERAGIVVTPGVGFGKFGKPYFRMTLTVEDSRIQEAIERMRKVL